VQKRGKSPLLNLQFREKLNAMIVRFRDINAEKNLRFREYNGGGYASKVLAIYDSIPSQLSKRKKNTLWHLLTKTPDFVSMMMPSYGSAME